MYKYLPEYNTVVCFTPCAAGVSMTTSLDFNVQDGQLRQRDVWLLREREGARVVIWLRNPIDRFLTQLKFFQKPAPKPVEEVIAFMRAPIAPDPHWISQVEQHTYSGIFLPTVVHDFESLDTTWVEEFPDKPLQFLNESTHVKPNLTPAEKADVMDVMKLDYWLGAQDFVVGKRELSPGPRNPQRVPKPEDITLPSNHIFNLP